MATSQGFNKPRINFKQVQRKKNQEKRKVKGKPEAGARAKIAVSGIRTKKHARKQAHKEKCAKLAVDAAVKKVAETEKKPAAAKEVAMKKVRTKKPKATKKTGAVDTDMQE